MPDVPKIVYDRLRAGAAEASHPDADVLTAFAEQALSVAEREGVVRHLAGCRDCREIVAMSIPPMETVVEPAAAAIATSSVPVSAVRFRAAHRGWFAWPNLRWAALAAGVVVVASVLFLRPAKQGPGGMVNLGRQTDEIAPTSARTEPATPPADQAPPGITTQAPKADAGIRQQAPERLQSPYSERRLRAQEGGLTKNSVSSLADNKRVDSLENNKLAQKAPAATFGNAAGAISTSEQVEVSSEQGPVASGNAEVIQAVPAEGKLVARNEIALPPPPVIKAKPAGKEEKKLDEAVRDNDAQLRSAFSVSDQAIAGRKLQSKDAAPQLSLSQGTLRRSLDSGVTWRTALKVDQPLLSFGERGSDVWAGGHGGALFHSADSGTTWTQVHPSTKAGALTADIVAIEIRGPAEIVLSTNASESWTTTDAGNTWEKK